LKIRLDVIKRNLLIILLSELLASFTFMADDDDVLGGDSGNPN